MRSWQRGRTDSVGLRFRCSSQSWPLESRRVAECVTGPMEQASRRHWGFFFCWRNGGQNVRHRRLAVVQLLHDRRRRPATVRRPGAVGRQISDG